MNSRANYTRLLDLPISEDACSEDAWDDPISKRNEKYIQKYESRNSANKNHAKFRKKSKSESYEF